MIFGIFCVNEALVYQSSYPQNLLVMHNVQRVSTAEFQSYIIVLDTLKTLAFGTEERIKITCSWTPSYPQLSTFLMVSLLSHYTGYDGQHSDDIQAPNSSVETIIRVESSVVALVDFCLLGGFYGVGFRRIEEDLRYISTKFHGRGNCRSHPEIQAA
jgi:hypothetical protein